MNTGDVGQWGSRPLERQRGGNQEQPTRVDVRLLTSDKLENQTPFLGGKIIISCVRYNQITWYRGIEKICLTWSSVCIKELNYGVFTVCWLEWICTFIHVLEKTTLFFHITIRCTSRKFFHDETVPSRETFGVAPGYLTRHLLLVSRKWWATRITRELE